MITRRFIFENKDNIKIYVYQWIPEKPIRGIIQISHGMAERAGRYRNFAKAMTDAGFVVYANDHRGHGKSAKSMEALGYISDTDGFNDMVIDMKTLTSIIKKENPGLPIILLGHSMGSFLAQAYIQRYGDDLNGLILSGSNGKPNSAINMGILIAKVIMITKGRKASGKILDHLSMGNYNKKIRPVKTKFDWLSRDAKQVKEYIDDPYCGTIFPVSFFYDLFWGMKEISKKQNLKQVPKNLPIYLFSGKEDPVGAYGKGVIRLYKMYKAQGVEDITCHLYTGGRHEMLHETNKQQVIQHILDWLDQQ